MTAPYFVLAVVNSLSRAREDRHLTQADIAVAVGVSKQAVSAWETGHREPPLSALDAYARAVGRRLQVGVSYDTRSRRLGAGRVGEDQAAPSRPKKKIPSRSPKAQAQWPIYCRDRDAYLADHPWCEFPGCVRLSTCLHHKRGREGRRLMDARWWAASCDEHNGMAETDTGAARDVGWLLSMHAGAEDRPEVGRFVAARLANRETTQ